MNQYTVQPDRIVAKRDPMIYGHFIEHFHRQIYGGIYDPTSRFADEDGFRTDVMDALRQIKPAILRWPGGCFVSAYDWKKGVGADRIPYFDKAWKVEESNKFGTDEYIKFCRKVGCEPYICTNAGSGTPEEMSDWVEYCNLENEGLYAKQRIANGYEKPHDVRYWSIGNENYGTWEIGAKTAQEWPYYVLESAKMMKKVDYTIELSAATLADADWNMNLLKTAGQFLDWVSIHEYWDMIHETNALATYEQSMAYTVTLDSQIKKIIGMLTALGLEDRIKISFDEWNLRGWYHPFQTNGVTKEQYLYPRDKNDDNSSYTMADGVFTACFLNTCNRYANIVKMANFAPVVNTRGAIFTHENGIVKRTTYHIFDLYANDMGDTIIDLWQNDAEAISVTDKWEKTHSIDALDVVATRHSDTGAIAIAVVNRSADDTANFTVSLDASVKEVTNRYISGDSTEAYNDIENPDRVTIQTEDLTGNWNATSGTLQCSVRPHSVNIITLK